MAYVAIHLLCALITLVLVGFDLVVFSKSAYSSSDFRIMAVLALIGGPLVLVFALLGIGKE